MYSIPVAAAPIATGGLKPNLALTYNHLAGNGLAGQAWTLTGFSAIRRCHMTYAQDGEAEAISYGSDDRFCLDGQRLVVTSGSYGGNGSVYSTELESFQRIKSFGTAGSGPQYFTVEHGDGSISYYGDTTDSRIEKVGASDVRVWYLSYTEDPAGNRISYGYDENTTTGEVLPDEVTWTSNANQGLSAKYKVSIVYETRPASDQRSGYEPGGAAAASTKRIDYIQVLYNTSTEIATYDLSYSTGTSGRSQLDQVTLCRGTDCLPETLFSWQDATVGWNNASSTSKSAGSATLLGDFDNDGHLDIFTYLSGSWQVYRGKTDGGLENAIDSGQSANSPGDARLIDYDGDGRSDVLYKGTNNYWYVMKSTGSGFATPINTNISSNTAPIAEVYDFDGDGLSDFLYASGTSLKWRRNTGSSLASAVTVESTYSAWPVPVNSPYPDFNGDGRTDRIMAGVGGCQPPPSHCYAAAFAEISTGSGYAMYDDGYWGGYLFAFDWYYGMPEFRTIDYNGDGLDDVLVVYPGSSTWYLFPNDGTKILPEGAQIDTGISVANSSSAIIADYNHDGLDDLLTYSSGTYYVHLSTGSTLSSSYTATFTSQAGFAGDITGDGHPDVVAISSGNYTTATAKSDLPDVVTGFEDGLGAGVDVTYKSLPQAAAAGNYVVDSGDTPSSDREQQFSGPRYVVTDADYDDGIGGTHNIHHEYDTAFIDRSGRGWLSFDNHIVYDDDAGTNQITFFKQDFPYAGVQSKTQLRRSSDDQVIKESVLTWDKTTNTTPTPDVHFIRVESTTSKDWEVGGTDDGDLIRTVVDNPTYNTTYGYVDERTVTTTDPTNTYTWTTYTDYDPSVNSTYWCLGLPGLVQTTHTKPDSSYATRKLDHSWNADCSLAYTIDQSDASTAKELKTSYTYDGYGNPNVVSTDSVDTSAQNRSVDYDYDSYGQYVTSETVGTVNLATTRTWDYVNGQPASVMGTDGITVSYDYDSFGRLESEDTPSIDTDYTYVACGTCFPGDAVYYVHADHSDGSDDYEYFDALNRSVGKAWTLRGGSQGRQETVYNGLGQVERVSQPYVSGETVYWVKHEYDLIGRETAQKAPISETYPCYPSYTTCERVHDNRWTDLLVI